MPWSTAMGFLDFLSGKKEKSEPRSGKSSSEESLRPLAFSIEDKELKALLPDLQKKQVLEIAPHQKSLDVSLEEKGAKVVRLGGAREKDQGKAGKFVFSHWENIPLLPGSQDVVLLRMAFLKSSPGRILKEAARVLSLSGKMIVSDFHPFGAFARSEGGNEPQGFERYWKSFEEAGLKIVSVREIFFESAMKKNLPEDFARAEALKNTPVLMIFALEKRASS